MDSRLVDAARLGFVHRRYHAAQAATKGWPDADRTEKGYVFQFVHNPIPSVEISVWEGQSLRAVALADITPQVVSGVYHFHEPDCRERSLGTFVMLHTLALAQADGQTLGLFRLSTSPGAGAWPIKRASSPARF